MTKDRIVAAVGTAVRSDVPGLAERMQREMASAIRKALHEGVPIDDTPELLARQRAALERVRDRE